MNINGKVTNMYAVRQAETQKYGQNKSKTLTGMVQHEM